MGTSARRKERDENVNIKDTRLDGRKRRRKMMLTEGRSTDVDAMGIMMMIA